MYADFMDGYSCKAIALLLYKGCCHRLMLSMLLFAAVNVAADVAAFGAATCCCECYYLLVLATLLVPFVAMYVADPAFCGKCS